MNRKERRQNRQKDHGKLSVPSDPQQEDKFFQHLMAKASLPANKGEAVGRVEATVTGKDGRVRVGHRTFHVNLRTNTLVITETWDGTETARRTAKIDEQPSQQKPGIFAPPPRRRPPGPVRPVRRPPDGLATHDADAVKAATIQRAENEITSTGRLPERITLVCDDHLEDLWLDDARAADPKGSALPTLASLAGRPGVNVRILTGELPATGLTRTGFVLGVVDGDPEGRFWLAKRQFRVGGGRIGTRGPWEVSDGIEWGGDWHELPRHLAASRKACDWGPAVSPPLPSIACAMDSFKPGTNLPKGASQYADAAAGMQEREAWTKGLDGLHVFAFRGREIERFIVRGEIPFGVDDLCRAIAARGDPPDAVATMSIGTFHDTGRNEIQRAVFTVAEAEGQRYKRILAMHWKPDAKPDDPAYEIQLWGSVPEDVAGVGWIGVAPVTELELFPIDAAEA